jgi:Tol biopolymer transport system component
LSSVSLDARFIAFWSDADDVVGNDTNGVRDVFVRDALSGASVLVSVNTNGVVGDGYSTDPAISADGRYVAFTSLADDLVKGDTNRALDIFLRDVRAGTTTLVSVNAAGTGPGNADSSSPVLSSDGHIVMFHSLGGNLSPGMIAGRDNLFWRDQRSGRTYALTTNQVADTVTAAAMTPDGGLVAFATGGSIFPALPHGLYVWGSGSASIVYSVAGNGTAFGPLAISPNGQKLAYVTNGAGTSQLVAVDLVLKTNWIIASYSGHSTSPPRFSADSRFLAYVGSLGSPVYTNQIYLYDFQSGTNQLISQSSDGSGPGNDDSDTPDLSSDGRFVSYRSAASNLVAGDLNGVPDIFLYDRQSGGTALVTASRFGNVSADNRSLMPVFSGDGRTLVFESWASDLMPGDFNNNVVVFALELYPGTAVPDFAISVLRVPSPVPHNWLSWPAIPGKSYRVEFKNQLSDSMWQDLSGQVSVVGNQGYFNDGTLVATRFYRIIAY